MMNFTQTTFKKFGLSLVAFLFCLSSGFLLQAQTPFTVKVNSPAAIAGNYASIRAAFGPVLTKCGVLSGELILVNDAAATPPTGTLTDACDTILNNLTGKIAVLDRGTCDFSSKVYRAQQKGAIAVLVVTNTTAAIGPMAAGANANLVTIPSFMISLADGNKIKAQLANGVNVSISQTLPELPSTTAEPIVWGIAPGQGDFNGGLNGWTSNTLSCNNGAAPDTFKLWRWSAIGDIRGACGVSTISSPTACNGAAVLESDFADSNGDSCGITGVGPCPSPHAAELVSPRIDVSSSTSTEDLILRYYQATREFDVTYLVAWTIDGGITWDTSEVNTDLDETAPVPSIQRVTLTGTQGADSLRVKFIFDGDYYYWAVDDVQIVELANNNLSVNPFFATAQNYATPLAHVEPIAFLSDIENVGAKAQTNVELNASVFYRATTTGAFTPVFSADKSYGTVPAGAIVENLPFDTTYTPDKIGQYAIQYLIFADSTDADEDNDFQTASFVVTRNQFSKDAVPNQAFRPNDSNWDANEPRSWAWGNYYYVPKAAGNYVQSVSFGFSTTGPVAGREALITLYEWEDTNQDEQADPDERIPVAFATYTFTGTETPLNLVTIPFPGAGEEPAKLKDSTAYLIMFEYYADDQAVFFMSSSDAIDYGAMVLANDSLGRRRYASFLGINDDLSVEPYSSIAFGRDIVPSVRMTVGSTPTSSKDLNILANNFTISPNPTNEILNLQLDLDKEAQNIIVRMFDLSGKLLRQWNYDNIQKARFSYDVNNLTNGTYFLQLITEQGGGTKKFIVAK